MNCEFSHLKVKELQGLLRAKNLKVSGRRDELIRRLKENVNETKEIETDQRGSGASTCDNTGLVPTTQVAEVKAQDFNNNSPKGYGNLSLKTLQIELKRRRLKCSGRKEDLIERLCADDKCENQRSAVDTDLFEDAIKYPVDWPPTSLFRSVSATSSVPDVDVVHITNYFLDVYKDNVGITEYQSVQRKSYSMLMSDFLCALVESKGQAIHFYTGQVNSEMTKRLTYYVQVAFSLDGNIIQSNCECVAGCGPKAVCKHVGVVCYAVLKFKETSNWIIRKTCTEKKQTWHAPKKAKIGVSPKKADQLSLEVMEFNTSKKRRGNLCYDPRDPNCIKADGFVDRVCNFSVNFSNWRGKNLGISGVFPSGSFEALTHDHDYLEVPLHHSFILNMIKVTQEKAAEIESKTRKQSQCKLWHSERSLRVTASNVGEICHFTERRSQQVYADNLVSPQPIHTQATIWGKAKEATAIECFEAMAGISVEKCGLFVSPEHPYIAASPDGLIAQLTVLEVKCPYSIRDEPITPENYKHIEVAGNELCLKKNSHYYYQVQTQMFVSGREFCDFFVWTNCDEKRISVARDEVLIETVIIPRVKEFYYTFMLPALQQKFFPKM